MKRAAALKDTRQAIEEGRLRVTELGAFFGRRSPKVSPWVPKILEKVRAPGRTSYYLRVTFSTSNGPFRCLAHRIVWFTFRGEIPKGLTVNHRNGVKTDNRLENLELRTQAENNAHAIKLGLHNPYAPKNWSIDAETVREVRRRAASGERQAQIARDLGLSTNMINRIVLRKTYRSVE